MECTFASKSNFQTMMNCCQLSFFFQIVANNGRTYLRIVPIFSNNAFAWSYFCSLFYRWAKKVKNKMGWSPMWLCSIMNAHGSITKNYHFFLFLSSSCFSFVHIFHPTDKQMFTWPPIIIPCQLSIFHNLNTCLHTFIHITWRDT